MYRAKHAGRDTVRFFMSEMNIEVLRRLEIEAALRNAVRNGEFVLHEQTKVQLDTGRVVGLEALLRWDRPGFGLTPSSEFIDALEDSGLIVDVGSWVINTACQQIRDWMRRGIEPLQVSVNVSARLFVKGDLGGDVLRALDANGIPGGLLEPELTETLLMTNAEAVISILESLKTARVQISVDDFGTGYSSLAYLRRFPIDKLKIDRSFIKEVRELAGGAAISLAIIQMGHSLDLTVIAEGVETAAQLASLREHHCDEMQGYYFSPPLAVPALERLLLAGSRLPTSDDESALQPRAIASAG